MRRIAKNKMHKMSAIPLYFTGNGSYFGKADDLAGEQGASRHQLSMLKWNCTGT